MPSGVVDIRVLGDKWLEAKLARLAGPKQKQIVRAALKTSLIKIGRPAIVAAVPVRTGRLKAAMASAKPVARTDRSGITVSVPMPTREEVGIAPRDPFYYPRHVEYGTKFAPAHSYIREPIDRAAPNLRAFWSARIGQAIERQFARGAKR